MRRFSHQKARQRRIALGVMREQVALECKRSASWVYAVEAGRITPSADVLPAYADALETTIEDLYDVVAKEAA